MNQTAEQYECANCHGVFDKDPEWTEQDVRKEAAENFGEEFNPDETGEVVCDDCYQKMIAWMPPEKWRELAQP